MKLYNTRTRSIEPLQPISDKKIRMYSCGPTVYDHVHIGNLSAYIFADILRRTVKQAGYSVQHAMNYTDVDDKTIRRSKERYPDQLPMEALRTLTDTYIDTFRTDMAKIGNDLEALHFMRATDPEIISGMQTLIVRLIESGFAYVASDGVYFSISAYQKSGKTYGQLLELSIQNTSAARIQNDEYDKESAHDFALWKIKKAGEPSWDFHYKDTELTGRPGWHIECSVMSRHALGQPFDIHTGGVDLIFPHHENEIAQSTAGETNPIMATVFAHNEHVLVDGKKMAKSASNFYTLKDIDDRGFDPAAFRLLVLQAHYRSQLHFSWDSLAAAAHTLNNLRNNLSWAYRTDTTAETPTPQLRERLTATFTAITDALFDDLNTPKALAALHELDSEVLWSELTRLDQPAIGSFAANIHTLLGLDLVVKDNLTSEQQKLLTSREAARIAKNWVLADQLRLQLEKTGIGLRDAQNSTQTMWVRLLPEPLL